MESPAQVLSSRSAPSARATVLVVDDEPLVARALKRLLRRTFDVLTAQTAAEALEVVDRHDVAVVLTDQRMPGMGGADLIALIRRGDPRVMGLLITAYADIDAVAAAINDAGVVGYIRKPWRDDQVAELVEHAVSMHNDARSRDRERAELARNEETVRVMVDQTPIGVALLGQAPQLTVIRYNNPFSQLIAAGPGSVVGSPLSHVLGDEAAETISALCLHADRTGEVLTSPELAWATGSGTVRHVTCTVSAVAPGFGGDPSAQQGFLLTAADITETVASREEARHLAALQGAILEQLPSGVVVVDAAGRTLVVNDLARRLQPTLADLSAANAARSDPRHAQYGHPLRSDELPLARALAGERVVDLEYRQHRPDGSDSWIRASATPLLTPENEIVGAVAVLTDISDDHLAEQARNIALASASHELRTPLTSALGFAGLLLSGELGALSPRQLTAVGRVKTSAERLNLLVDDIIEISSIESGHLNLRPSWVNIGALLATVVESFATQTRSKHQQVILDHSQVDLFAWADEHRLHQVVDNLISNAHKYTLEGGRIVVAASQNAAGTLVTVEDTGVGLTEDELGSLYTKFYRARNTATWDIPGTGLGLAIARALVEAHGGTMSVASTPGEGSVFGFRLPGGWSAQEGRSSAAQPPRREGQPLVPPQDSAPGSTPHFPSRL